MNLYYYKQLQTNRYMQKKQKWDQEFFLFIMFSALILWLFGANLGIIMII